MRKLILISLSVLTLSSICFAFFTGHAPPRALAGECYSNHMNHCWVVRVERIDDHAVNLGKSRGSEHDLDTWSEYQLLKCRILKRLTVIGEEDAKFVEPIDHDEYMRETSARANLYPCQFLYLIRPVPDAQKHLRAANSSYKAGKVYICTAKETTVTGLYTPYADCENMIPHSPDAEKKFVADVVTALKARKEE